MIAHTRRNYLRAAVKSVLEQDLDRSQYEILVVKGFVDSEIDPWLRETGAENIVSIDTGPSPKFALGIRRSRAPIITFLEDDDFYEPRRLSRIRHAFEIEPSLGFYHHGFSIIGKEGLEFRRQSLRGVRPLGIGGARSRLLTDTSKERESRRLAGLQPEFNTSSCAISRRAVEPALPYLERMHSCADTIFFFAAMIASCSLLVNTEPLTRYRIHGENVTVASDATPDQRAESLYSFARRCDDDYRVIREFVRHEGSGRFLSLIDARLWVNGLTLALRSPSGSRRDFVRLLRQLPPYVSTYPVREDLLGLAVIPPFLVSPSLGRQLYWRQATVQ